MHVVPKTPKHKGLSLAQKRADPNVRSTLKDSQLTTGQLRERKRLAAKKATSSTSGRPTIEDVLNAAVTTQYGSQQSDLGEQTTRESGYDAPGGAIDQVYEAYNRYANDAQSHLPAAQAPQSQPGGGQSVSDIMRAAIAGYQAASAHGVVEAHHSSKLRLDDLGKKKSALDNEIGAFKVKYGDDLRKQSEELALAYDQLGEKSAAEKERLRISEKGIDTRASTAKASLQASTTAHQTTAAEAKRVNDARIKHWTEQDAAKTTKKVGGVKKLAKDLGGVSTQDAQKWISKKAKIVGLSTALQQRVKRGESLKDAKKALRRDFGSRLTDSELNIAADLATRKGGLSAATKALAHIYFPGGHIPGGFLVGRSNIG